MDVCVKEVAELSWVENAKRKALELKKKEEFRRDRLERFKATEESLPEKVLDKCDMIIEAINEQKVEDASLKELSGSFGTLYEKLRLMQNKSTANVNVNNLSGMISRVSSTAIDLGVVDASPTSEESTSLGVG